MIYKEFKDMRISNLGFGCMRFTTDPETGEIIPTSGKRGRPAKKKEAADNDPGTAGQNAAMDKLMADYEEIKAKNQELIKENRRLKAILAKIEKAISEA